ncbi:hypothetical protein ACFOEH_03390 [Roseomonas sp. CGMCC 1.13459]|uniref:Class I SAM-dependent methyltransferase n=2 Tax=Acetobacterales TaxID=3120395 RepID=A0ABS6H3Y8_9PROT|nr:class I SAM-dependent methyltransferase [Roseomonas oleicola]
MSLNDIGLKYKTDKSSVHHDYLGFYESFLAGRRAEPIRILEVGVLNGASLRMWEEYFPAATVIGADIVPASRRFERGRVRIEILDQSNIEELTQLAVRHGPFDLIIEDGSHMCEHQITSLRTLFPFVRNGGIYIVEDLQTNYGAMLERYRGVASETCMEYLKRWVDLRVSDDQTDIASVEDAFLRTYGRSAQFLTFYRRACLIKKNVRAVDRSGGAGTPLLTSCAVGVPVEVFAHVSHAGDVFGGEGFIHFSQENRTLQGISLRSEAGVLEYAVRPAGGTWTSWMPEEQFAGTRGQSKPLIGVKVRLKSGHDKDFGLEVAGRFVGGGDPVVVPAGAECAASEAHLRGLHVLLFRSDKSA